MKIECPECHSDDLRKAGTRLLTGNRRKQLWQCRKCGRMVGGEIMPK